jgi:hypothetical protein
MKSNPVTIVSLLSPACIFIGVNFPFPSLLQDRGQARWTTHTLRLRRLLNVINGMLANIFEERFSIKFIQVITFRKYVPSY